MGPTCNYPVGLSAAYGTIARPVYNYSGPHVRRPYHGEYHTYLGTFSEYRLPLHCSNISVYNILTIKQVQLANMEPIPLDDPI